MTSATLTAEAVRAALRGITGPGIDGDLSTSRQISEISIRNGQVVFAITVDPKLANELEPMRQAAERAVSSLPGVSRAIIALTAEARTAPRPQPAHRPHAPRMPATNAVPGIRHIIAVASGKGGVGKSTTAVNLALGLAGQDLRVGLLDADIYGPSLPRLLGVTARPTAAAPGSKVLAPLEAFGVKVMSMGFLVEENTAMIWRGPMVMSALQQMLREVAWGELDILVVDMPPGTGDAQLTLAQQTPLAGAVIVSTPQDLALIDARRGIAMFRKVNVPVIGIVENMSYFLCATCGTRHEIFGHGGAREEAEKLGVPFLGEVPLDQELRERSDSGRPVVVTAPDSLHSGIYRDMAAKVWHAVSGTAAARRPAPRIIVE
ncbi:MAG: iron-sulfur cluster carrier protein ApbC [Aestuariivirgaceae bacterium]